ncbi:RNA polymerase Rpb6 [Methanohalobium evestigatum Z-7303]|uniref:DNA-directed RNA polymerase subunit Rpo6 n=1 Tax=Methanohalobium evestigatum (strain ATCC BAA-1072 / DSM 3721 / NBRC 107634 / OCM 161 / Z-7303) TaxID=644295 RepID=D7E6M3_METEZ|nr:DNA-directed RNA polymerase subunit K [Methanohalobium evestigatum]ADI73245.1 RNA polymerase Rpb6 [Methanohalobium evestigatum Z-7303]
MNIQTKKQTFTRYERARIIGARALQISMDAPILIENVENLDPLQVAIEELKHGVIPVTVKRELRK